MLGAMYISTFDAVVSRQVSISANIEMTKLFIIFLLTCNLLNSVKYINLFLWVIGFAATLTSLRGIRAHILWDAIRLDYYGGGGQILDSNDLCAALVMIFPFLFYKIFSKNKIEKLLGLCWAPLVLFCIILTNSRSGNIALLVILILILIRAIRKIRIILPMAVILILGLYFAPEEYYDRMKNIVNYQTDPSAVGRIELWKAGIRMWKDYPLTGIGQDNFELLISQYYKDIFSWQSRIATHNTYIQLLVEGGIQTLILFLLLVFLSIKDALVITRKVPEVSDLAYSICIGFIGFLICCIFLSRLIFVPLYWFIALPIALKDVTLKRRSQ
jgi:probable O-glycosylation ligase (exosortase A-associated)